MPRLTDNRDGSKPRYFPYKDAPMSTAMRRLLDDPRVDRSGECWAWMGARTTAGYGRLGHVYVHRLAYFQEIGPFDQELEICHRCDNPPCVRPDHLFTGTHRENLRDARSKGRLDTSNLWRRSEWTHCLRGHPLEGDNLYVYPSGRRECRTCRRNRWKERQNERARVRA